MKLKNKVALITGGSSGIGLATAKLFLQEGAYVIITGTNQEKLEIITKELGKNCLGLIADIADLNSIDNLYQRIDSKIDVLVANAGIVQAHSVEEATEEIYDKVMNVNVKGTFFTVQKSLPHLNSPASIILISSLAAKAGMESFSIYCASKAAITSFAKTFAAEFAAMKIRVNSISPGVVRTPIFDQVGVTDQDLQDWSKLIPLRRVAEPEEIANTALYLASDQSSYVTAADFAVDGGLSGVSLF